MSTPELLTDRELALLTAVRQVLDLPYPASSQDRERYEMAMRERVFRLLGIFEVSRYVSAANVLGGLRDVAARPLGYEPAPDEASP